MTVSAQNTFLIFARLPDSAPYQFNFIYTSDEYVQVSIGYEEDSHARWVILPANFYNLRKVGKGGTITIPYGNAAQSYMIAELKKRYPAEDFDKAKFTKVNIQRIQPFSQTVAQTMGYSAPRVENADDLSVLLTQQLDSRLQSVEDKINIGDIGKITIQKNKIPKTKIANSLAFVDSCLTEDGYALLCSLPAFFDADVGIKGKTSVNDLKLSGNLEVNNYKLNFQLDEITGNQVLGFIKGPGDIWNIVNVDQQGGGGGGGSGTINPGKINNPVVYVGRTTVGPSNDLLVPKPSAAERGKVLAADGLGKLVWIEAEKGQVVGDITITYSTSKIFFNGYKYYDNFTKREMLPLDGEAISIIEYYNMNLKTKLLPAVESLPFSTGTEAYYPDTTKYVASKHYLAANNVSYILSLQSNGANDKKYQVCFGFLNVPTKPISATSPRATINLITCHNMQNAGQAKKALKFFVVDTEGNYYGFSDGDGAVHFYRLSDHTAIGTTYVNHWNLELDPNITVRTAIKLSRYDGRYISCLNVFYLGEIDSSTKGRPVLLDRLYIHDNSIDLKIDAKVMIPAGGQNSTGVSLFYRGKNKVWVVSFYRATGDVLRLNIASCNIAGNGEAVIVFSGDLGPAYQEDSGKKYFYNPLQNGYFSLNELIIPLSTHADAGLGIASPGATGCDVVKYDFVRNAARIERRFLPGDINKGWAYMGAHPNYANLVVGLKHDGSKLYMSTEYGNKNTWYEQENFSKSNSAQFQSLDDSSKTDQGLMSTDIWFDYNNYISVFTGWLTLSTAAGGPYPFPVTAQNFNDLYHYRLPDSSRYLQDAYMASTEFQYLLVEWQDESEY
jgi:hypothetical protein